MTLSRYRQITGVKFNNATGNGTDNTVDQATVDPNKYLITPLNQKAQVIMAVLVSILTFILIIKEIKRII